MGSEGLGVSMIVGTKKWSSWVWSSGSGPLISEWNVSDIFAQVIGKGRQKIKDIGRDVMGMEG